MKGMHAGNMARGDDPGMRWMELYAQLGRYVLYDGLGYFPDIDSGALRFSQAQEKWHFCPIQLRRTLYQLDQCMHHESGHARCCRQSQVKAGHSRADDGFARVVKKRQLLEC
nr:hypothetical protein GCM10020185_75990 [Pseudomonas brassicacearum subsp. brassicacearum]